MPIPSAIFFTLAVSHLFLLGLHVLLYHRKSSLGVLSCLLVTSLICYLSAEALSYWSNNNLSNSVIVLRMIFHRLGDTSVFLIWLIAFKLFNDEGDFRNLHPLVWVVAGSVPAIRGIGSYYVNFDTGNTGIVYPLTWIYSQTVILGFACGALYLTVKGYQSDLLAERRKERVVFVLSVAVLLVIMVINRGVWVIDLVTRSFPYRQPVPTVFYFVYAYVVVTALFLWKFDSSSFSLGTFTTKAHTKSEPKVTAKKDKELMARITRAMVEENLYHHTQLTVAGLAEHVGSQEYLVRRAINQHLGYRNFSEFLNHYRIQETVKLLVGSSEPITNIGLDVGYSSLSSFYKAFKAKHGVTPKEYRLENRPMD